jgi:hypothetical protein
MYVFWSAVLCVYSLFVAYAFCIYSPIADDMRYGGYPALFLGVTSGSVTWRTSITGNVPLNNLTYPTVFSQSNALANVLQLGAYLRIVYSNGVFSPMFRQTLSASWTPVFSVTQATRYGGAIPASQMYLGVSTNNWSTQRGAFYVSYVAIGTSTCASPGSTRYLPSGGPAVITGLSPGTTYVAQVMIGNLLCWLSAS